MNKFDYSMGMRALITGIHGFVGSYLAEHLLAEQTWQVWGLARSERPLLPALREQVTVVYADLTDAAQTSQAVLAAQPQVIFHLAGQPFIPESFRDPATTLTVNTFGLLHLVQALIAHTLPARIVVVGTNDEYGRIHQNDLPVDEDTPLRPVSPYGVSKVAQSLLALQYHLSHQVDVVRLRPFTHLGPRQSARFVSASFARQIARIEQGLQPPTMKVGNLSAQRDFTDVRDMVQAYALAARCCEAGAVYNIGSGRAVAIQTLLDTLLNQSKVSIDVQVDPALLRPIDIPVVMCDTRRFAACTDWQPVIPLEQTLTDVLDYWREQVSRV